MITGSHPPSRKTVLLAATTLALVAVLVSTVWASGPAWAATITVNSTADDADGADGECTLREAITAASTDTASGTATGECAAGSGEDEIRFALPGTAPWTVNLTGALPLLDSDITISGPGADLFTVRRDTGDDYRIFTVASGSVVSISGITVTNGNTRGDGGGIYNDGGTLTIADSAITDNTGSRGGGIANRFGTLTIARSAVSDNTAGDAGGGVYSFTDQTTTVSNSTISGNTATDFVGGGLYNFGGRTVIKYSTVTDNTSRDSESSDDGSGVYSFPGTSTRTEVLSTIISANSKTDVASSTSSNSFVSNGHNVIGDGNATGAFNQTGDQTGLDDPLLGALANNGGPTQTHALLPDSPAIDAGRADLATDQRGVSRPQDGDGDGTVQDDVGSFELAPGSLRFAAETSAAKEDVGTVAITVLRRGGTDGEVSVRYATSDGTAEAGSDYAARSGEITFADGQERLTFTVPIKDDQLFEPDETVRLELSNATGGATLGEPEDSVLFIRDDDARPSLSISNERVTEGDGGTTVASFTVSLSRESGESAKVDYATADGTAGAPSDYASRSGTLGFSPGQTRKSVQVPVKGDTLDEPNETFSVLLSDPSNATVSDDQGVGTIVDDDECTIVGTGSSDSLLGTAGRDVICALGGDDTVLALGGDDLVRGGPGDDTIQASSGADTVGGAGGDDAITGNDGPDSLVGGEGEDLLSGQGGDDDLDARDGSGGDELYGGPGTDACRRDGGDEARGCP